MAPLVLEGVTLGEKHRHYNGALKVAVADQTLKLKNINYEDSDIDNLFMIDIACNRRDIEYILDVLTCDDMLYVTRAINRSTWLITEDKYAHIINPAYLNDTLFPKMTTRAKNKFLLTIRLNLKNPTRVETFFTFYKNDMKMAQKWLPRCSFPFIENIMEKEIDNIDMNTLKRLCENSFEVYKVYITKSRDYYKKNCLIKKCTFLLKSHTVEYLDLFDSMQPYEKHKLGRKPTQIIMTKSRERIISNFAKYCYHIDIPTFAENMKKEEIQDFLLKQKDDVAMQNWFKFPNIKHFIKFLPKENKFQFIKSLALDKKKVPDGDYITLEMDACPKVSLVQYSLPVKKCGLSFGGARGGGAVHTNAHIYRWYRYAPFSTALPELKKLIHVESNPSERNAILTILIHSAGSNPKYIQTLLEFYREKHLNEPFKFKIQFVNSLLSLTKTHQYDDNTWGILNDIFSSMEVFMESENNVPFCIQAIIVYHLLHNQKIPEIVQKKFTFSTFKDYRKKLNVNEQDILFSYLYDHVMTILNNKKITNEAEMSTALNTLQQAIDLLSDWDKNLADYPAIINKIKELTTLRKESSWDIDLTNIYKLHKKWRRYLFEESFALHPTEEACLNALKHDPELLSRYEKEVQAMFYNDSVSLKRVLRKLRIYWTSTIAQDWTKIFFDNILQLKGQKSILKNLCIISSQSQILPLIKENTPTETKINWADSHDDNINLRKNIAKNMHLVRPSLNLETVLLYAKDDYLLFTLPSLSAILYNMSSKETSDCIMQLLDAPVSLQKHGIRAAFNKLKINDITGMIQNIWKNTKNSSIKTVLFQQTFQMLSKAKNPTAVNNIWELFNMYLDSLESEENRIIYNIFEKVKNVPIAVRPAFFAKGYLYLKSLPPKAKCEGIINSLNDKATSIIHLLDPQFIEDILLEHAGDKIITKNLEMQTNSSFNILSSYLLSSNTEEIQSSKYEKLLLPILENSFAIWSNHHKGNHYVKVNVTNLLLTLVRDLCNFTVTKNNIVPLKLFKDIENKMVTTLPIDDNYNMIINWRITVLFVEELNRYLQANPISITEIAEQTTTECTPRGCASAEDKTWTRICSEIAKPFGYSLLTFLKQETYLDQYPYLYSCVADQIMDNLNQCRFSILDKYVIIKAIISDTNTSAMYYIAVEWLNSMAYQNSKEVLPIKREIYEMIRSNPSPGVKILFNHRLGSYNHDEDTKVVQPFRFA